MADPTQALPEDVADALGGFRLYAPVAMREDGAPAPAERAPFERARERAGDRKMCLHVGCGPARRDKLNRLFHGADWFELRYDIDPGVEPDLVGSITDLAVIPDRSVEAVWSSHNIEHLYAHEVPIALREFQRVLKPGGALLITLPDLQAVCRLVAEGRLEAVISTSVDGTMKIRPLDVIYGWGAQIEAGRTYMAHRTGFTAQSLGAAIAAAGFPRVQVARGGGADLWALTVKDSPDFDQAILARAMA